MTSMLMRQVSSIAVGGARKALDPIDVALRGTGDRFMMKDDLEETVKGTTWAAILTDRAFLKVEPDGEVRQRKELIDIHSVEADPADATAFFMYSYKSAAALQADKVKGMFGFGMRFEEFLQQRRFKCASEAAAFEWVLVLNRLVRDAWQRIFESSFIPSPEIYQCHAFVIKLNRKGVAQERTLVVSNEWVYNVEMRHAPTGVKDFKWALPIVALRSVELTYEEDQPCATFSFDDSVAQQLMDEQHVGAKKGAGTKDTHSFVFNDRGGRGKVVRELQRLAYKTSGARLAISEPQPDPAVVAAAEKAAEAAEPAIDPKVWRECSAVFNFFFFVCESIQYSTVFACVRLHESRPCCAERRPARLF